MGCVWGGDEGAVTVNVVVTQKVVGGGWADYASVTMMPVVAVVVVMEDT